MASDKAVGAGLVALGVIVTFIYGVILFYPHLFGLSQAASMDLVKLTVFVAVASVMGVLAWIGYTLATTPPPKPIEEIEKELEEELKRLEKELEESGEEAGGTQQ